MNHSPRLDAEKLVEIHKARDEWEGNLLIGYLRDTNSLSPQVAVFADVNRDDYQQQ
jgi:hypothetical protein